MAAGARTSSFRSPSRSPWPWALPPLATRSDGRSTASSMATRSAAIPDAINVERPSIWRSSLQIYGGSIPRARHAPSATRRCTVATPRRGGDSIAP